MGTDLYEPGNPILIKARIAEAQFQWGQDPDHVYVDFGYSSGVRVPKLNVVHTEALKLLQACVVNVLLRHDLEGCEHLGEADCYDHIAGKVVDVVTEILLPVRLDK